MPRLFALDRNFPQPIVGILSDFQADATLVPLDRIDKRMSMLDDWELLLALHHHADAWDGLITTDSSMLAQGSELAALIQTKLTLVVAVASGHNPVKASGLLFAYLAGICQRTTSDRAQVWRLNAANRPPEEPWDFLKRFAEHNDRSADEVWADAPHPRPSWTPSPARMRPNIATSIHQPPIFLDDTPRIDALFWLSSAYEYDPGESGAGQTVAIVDAYDDPKIEADLGEFDKNYKLAECTTANGCFKKVNQSGAATPLPSPESGWAVEISLDVETVHSVCPKCKILLVKAKEPTYADLAVAVNEAVKLGATEVSNSYGGTEEAGGEAAYQTVQRDGRRLQHPPHHALQPSRPSVTVRRDRRRQRVLRRRGGRPVR
jgi:hypothetical protein